MSAALPGSMSCGAGPTKWMPFLYAFDLLELDGTDLRREPLEVRKATLASILRQSRPGVRLNEHLAHDCGLTVFQHACQLGCEGIVSKKATVEGSLVLTASALVRKKALVPGAQTAGSWGGPMRGRTVRTPPYGTRQTSATSTMHGFGCTTGPTGRQWTTKSGS